MRTLHGYLTRQVLATLLMTVAVFTFVLLLGNALKEIMELLVNRQATLWGVLQAFGLLVPFVLVFALPMGMLTAALLVFGRFSADQELTAVRSSGISLVALISPILVLSLLLCGVSAWMNMEVGPRCRVAYNELVAHMRVKLATTMLPEQRFVTVSNSVYNYMIYAGRVDGPELKDVLAIELNQNQEVMSILKAPRGRLDATNQLVTLHLFEPLQVGRGGDNGSGGELTVGPFNLGSSGKKDKGPPLTDMTFRQLYAELQRLETRFSLPTSRDLTPDKLLALQRELQQERKDLSMAVRVQIHRQVAFSFACFGFTLVGIPLGIRAHRRETNVGIAMALALVLVYYSFIILGQSLQTHAELAPHLIVWLPNFIFQAAGAVMLWRANKGI